MAIARRTDSESSTTRTRERRCSRACDARFGRGAQVLVVRAARELGHVEQRNHAAVAEQADAGDAGNTLEIAARGARDQFAGVEHGIDQHADGPGLGVDQHEIAALRRAGGRAGR